MDGTDYSVYEQPTNKRKKERKKEKEGWPATEMESEMVQS